MILARNLLTSISTPAFLLDEHAALVFYNEAAGALLGRSFEETGRMSPEEWTSTFGPFDDDGKPDRRSTICPPPRRSATAGPPMPCSGSAPRTATEHEIEASAFPIVASEEGSSGAMIFFWPLEENGGERPAMKVKVWGARGSVPAPGPKMNRYGGNTSCVQVTLASGEELILDAGTGHPHPRAGPASAAPKVNILLTHLHLDHIQGLMFFPPCFRSDVEITIWGPASPEASLEDRIARYISAPLSPVEVRELPCSVSFRDTPPSEWPIGSATIRAEAVTHRGPTLGYRITEGDTTRLLHPRPRAGPRRRRSPTWSRSGSRATTWRATPTS